MLFPKSPILELKNQTGPDLERFDRDFDLPDHFIPSFPPAIFLTTRHRGAPHGRDAIERSSTRSSWPMRRSESSS